MEREVELFIKADYLLGEGPIWDDVSNTLYWTDIEQGEIHFYNEETGKLNQYNLGDKVTSIALCNSGSLLITRTDTIARYNPVTGKEQTIVHKNFPNTVRFNDGKCDPSGRFYADSMDTEEKEEVGSLFVLDQNGGFYEAASGLVIGNGLAWNKEETVLYLADSTRKTIYQFEYCAGTGALKNRKTAFILPHNTGVPDGMCIDSEGMLWIAHYYGARITRWDPIKGELLETIPVPASNVTSCCFGGPEMMTLYITTSNMNLPEITEADHHDGSIFKIETDVKGCKTVRFNDGMFPCF